MAVNRAATQEAPPGSGANAPKELNDLTHHHVADKHGVPVIAEAEGRKTLTSGTAVFMRHLIGLWDEKPAEGWEAT